MHSTSEFLSEMALRLEGLCEGLLLRHSHLKNWNVKNDSIAIISVSGDFNWEPISEEGRRLQSKALDEYQHFYAILKSLLRSQPNSTLEDLKETHEVISGAIQQDGHTWSENVSEAFLKVKDAITRQRELVHRLYFAT